MSVIDSDKPYNFQEKEQMFLFRIKGRITNYNGILICGMFNGCTIFYRVSQIDR